MAAPRSKSAIGIGMGPIVYGPVPNQAPYAYRSYTGIIPTAEWTVFFDDFTQGVTGNVPTGWSSSAIDTLGTVTQNTTAALGANGVLTLAHATASNGAAIFQTTKPIQLTTAKRFCIETRVRTDDVTDNFIFVGVSDLTSVATAVGLSDTTSANGASFGLIDGVATTSIFSDKANSGTVAQATAGTGAPGIRTLAINTWHTLALSYDGTILTGWVDGKLSQIWQGVAATIPTGVALSPVVGFSNGNGAGGALFLVDYLRYAIER